MSKPPKPYPSDVSDEEWEFCAPYLTLMKEEAPQRTHSLRQVYNALRWLVRAGCSWRLMPHEFVRHHGTESQGVLAWTGAFVMGTTCQNVFCASHV